MVVRGPLIRIRYRFTLTGLVCCLGRLSLLTISADMRERVDPVSITMLTLSSKVCDI
ncbi:hypothetical protein AVEN_221191-1, partial [Araneus ventricosus]